MTYRPSENWNQRLTAPYWLPLSSRRDIARENLNTAFTNGTIQLVTPTECYCGGQEFALICDGDRFGLPFKAKLCRKCGLILTDPYLSEKDMPLYYNNYYHQIMFGKMPRKALFGSNQGRLVFERVWAYDPALIVDKARVLEIGAGLGNVLQEFGESAKEKGFELNLMGTEYSQECLAAIRGQGIIAVEGGCLDVLAVSDTPIDIIILSHVLEHVTDLDGFMAGLKNLASPATLLYVEVPGVLTLHAKPEYDFDFRKYFIHAHSAHYNFNTLKYHMARFGWSCLTGNEIAYGLFRLSSDIAQLPDVSGLADQVLFYLANMEVAFESSTKVADRLRSAESGLRASLSREKELEAKRQADLKQLEAKRQADLKQLEAKRQADLQQLEAKRQADLKLLDARRQADLAMQKSELEAQPISKIIKARCRCIWKHLGKRGLWKRIRKEYSLLKGSDMFDGGYYLLKNPDVAKSGMDPLLHYIRFGWKEKRNPGTQFDVAYYLEKYPDVRASGKNPLVHYIKYGKNEGRKPMAYPSKLGTTSEVKNNV